MLTVGMAEPRAQFYRVKITVFVYKTNLYVVSFNLRKNGLRV